MLLAFQVSNWGSFSEPTMFTMRATREQAFKDTLYSLRNRRVLPVSAIYGANAAGKSQLVKAIWALQQLATDATTGIDYADRPHLNDGLERPSKFLVEFAVKADQKESLFVYEVHVFGRKVVFEELTRVGWDDEFVLYRRTRTSPVELFEGLEKDKQVLACATLVKSSQTLLSLIAQLEHKPEPLAAVINWMTAQLLVIGPHTKYALLPARVKQDLAFRTGIREFLNIADTGISEIDFEDVALGSTGLPPELQESIRTALLEATNDVGAVAESAGNYYLLELENRLLTAKQLVARHGDRFSLPLSDESDGTVRFLNLFSVLLAMKANEAGSVVIVDALERSLHPVLTSRFVKAFLQIVAASDNFSQLIFTTHETSLLSCDLLRRDEIWFAEKQNHASVLQRLSDYRSSRVRKGNDVEKMYLQGRLGAITRTGDELP